MSAQVIPMPGAMTPAQRQHRQQRAEARESADRTRRLNAILASLQATRDAEERAEAARVREMVVTLRLPRGRRRVAAVPRDPGPDTAA